MNHESPCQSPTRTGRSSALPALSMIQTKCPFALCCTARCGTDTAFGRTEPCRRVRTNWFGRSRPCGFSTLARSRNVPVCGLYDGSAKVMRPAAGKVEPSTRTISTANCRFGGSLSLPSRTSRWTRSYSFSEMLKLIHIGESTDTVVSWLFCALT